MNWQAVGVLDDIPINSGACAWVHDQEIAIFRLADNQLFAIDNIDPFTGVPVLSRGIIGDLQGEIVVASPLYKQHFSLKTGQCLEQPTLKVKTWPVRLSADTIEIGRK